MKKVPQDFDSKKCDDTLHFFQTNAEKDIHIEGQPSEENPKFIWHMAKDYKKTLERFQIELQLDHPHLKDVFKKLDAFIKKYHSGYKVKNLNYNRSDTLNVYMGVPITPQIAKELCEIVGPYLKDEHHDLLSGYPIKKHGKEIKGIKYAVEPVPFYDGLSSEWQKKVQKSIIETLTKDLPKYFLWPLQLQLEAATTSVGQVDAMSQVMDLAYYLAGKEGKSPFQMGNQYGLPLDGSFPSRLAQKYVDKNIDIATVDTPTKSHPAKTSSSTAYPTKIQMIPCEDDQGNSGIHFLDEQGKEILTRYRLGKDAYENVYPNGIHVITRKGKDGKTTTTISDPNAPLDGWIIKKDGRTTSESKGTGVVYQKIEEIQKTGRTYGQIEKVLISSNIVVPWVCSRKTR